MRRSYGGFDEALVFQATGEMRQGIVSFLAALRAETTAARAGADPARPSATGFGRVGAQESERAGPEGGAPGAGQGEGAAGADDGPHAEGANGDSGAEEGDGAAGADDGRHAEGSEDGSEVEDEMLYSTERSSSSES